MRRRPEPPKSPRAAAGTDRRSSPRGTFWLWAACLLLGAILRLPAFTGHHVEGDEVVYHGLVTQLDAGRGYHLRGLDLPDQVFPGEQFASRLFYHPPAGIAGFWLFWRIFGEAGFALSQLAAYVVFFFAMRALTVRWIDPGDRVATGVAALLAATTPIVVHVQTCHWLDGPLIAVATVAAVVWVDAFRARGIARAALAGALLGLASLVKTTAFLMLPGLLLVGWALDERPRPDRRWLLCALVATLTALLVQAPWEIWQWVVLGSPFPYWAGRPVERLVSDNPYIWYVTVQRSPFVYLQVLPICVWTTIPALLAAACLGAADHRRRLVLALGVWVVVVVAAHVVLGTRGYSKLLRYVILITPAMIALSAWAASRLFGTGASPIPAPMRRILQALLVAGVGLEAVQGVMTAFNDPAIHMVVSLAETFGILQQP